MATEVKVADRISDRVLVKDEYLIRIVKTNGVYIKHHHNIDESNGNSNDSNDEGNDVTVVTTTEVSQENVDLSILVDSNKRKFIDIATTDVTENNININTTTNNVDINATTDDNIANNHHHNNQSKIDRDRDAEVNKKIPMKKRHQTSRPSKEDRLCSYALQGVPCPHDKCSYSHDLSQFLSSKPPDIGDRCYLFDTYGFCSYGITCRFGDSHIDRITCMNITRSDHQNTTTTTGASATTTTGGSMGSKPQQINVLSKEVQLHLRKKRYDYWSNKKKMSVDAVLVEHDNDDVVVTEVVTDAAATAVGGGVDVPVVINATIVCSPIKNDDMSASGGNNGSDDNIQVTSGDDVVNNNILNDDSKINITDPLSIPTSTTSSTIITTSINNDSSSILSTALIPTPSSQHHSLQVVPSTCPSTTLHKPVEVSLKPYPTKSMKLLDFSNKVYYNI